MNVLKNEFGNVVICEYLNYECMNIYMFDYIIVWL